MWRHLYTRYPQQSMQCETNTYIMNTASYHCWPYCWGNTWGYNTEQAGILPEMMMEFYSHYFGSHSLCHFLFWYFSPCFLDSLITTRLTWFQKFSLAAGVTGLARIYSHLVCSTSLTASLIRSVGGLSKCFYQGLWLANLTADVIGRSMNRRGVA